MLLKRIREQKEKQIVHESLNKIKKCTSMTLHEKNNGVAHQLINNEMFICNISHAVTYIGKVFRRGKTGER